MNKARGEGGGSRARASPSPSPPPSPPSLRLRPRLLPRRGADATLSEEQSPVAGATGCPRSAEFRLARRLAQLGALCDALARSHIPATAVSSSAGHVAAALLRTARKPSETLRAASHARRIARGFAQLALRHELAAVGGGARLERLPDALLGAALAFLDSGDTLGALAEVSRRLRARVLAPGGVRNLRIESVRQLFVFRRLLPPSAGAHLRRLYVGRSGAFGGMLRPLLELGERLRVLHLHDDQGGGGPAVLLSAPALAALEELVLVVGPRIGAAVAGAASTAAAAARFPALRRLGLQCATRGSDHAGVSLRAFTAIVSSAAGTAYRLRALAVAVYDAPAELLSALAAVAPRLAFLRMDFGDSGAEVRLPAMPRARHIELSGKEGRLVLARAPHLHLVSLTAPTVAFAALGDDVHVCGWSAPALRELQLDGCGRTSAALAALCAGSGPLEHVALSVGNADYGRVLDALGETARHTVRTLVFRYCGGDTSHHDLLRAVLRWPRLERILADTPDKWTNPTAVGPALRLIVTRLLQPNIPGAFRMRPKPRPTWLPSQVAWRSWDGEGDPAWPRVAPLVWPDTCAGSPWAPDDSA